MTSCHTANRPGIFPTTIWLLLILAIITAPLGAAAKPRVPQHAAQRLGLQPIGDRSALRPLSTISAHRADRVDADLEIFNDSLREARGELPNYAVPQETRISPETHGVWESLSHSTRLWRYRILSPGALSLNLGFTRYELPPGARLLIYAPDSPEKALVFSEKDNKSHRELWTPIIPGDELVLELRLPTKERQNLDLLLGSVNVGYRDFNRRDGGPDKAGLCNIDVVCPEAAGWENQIQTVAVYSTGGGTFCTGFMINNTRNDETPYFLTANHCPVGASTAPSLVVYWNFHNTGCGLPDTGIPDPSMSQSGATLRAASETSDFKLLELDELPDPEWEIAYAGWDRGTGDPLQSTCIHHPSTDEKAISFDYDPATTTTYDDHAVPGNGTHIRIGAWDRGTTEGGSSGSPLFNQDGLVVGQLHGGWAACSTVNPQLPNAESDWYGRFSISWDSGLSPGERLRDWLDPESIGGNPLRHPMLTPYIKNLVVSPVDPIEAEGNPGGPFQSDPITYTLRNTSEADLDFSIDTTAGWLTISPDTGILEPDAEIPVAISFNSAAEALSLGYYSADIRFNNLSSEDPPALRTINLLVGVRETIYAFPMDTSPGWSAEGAWGFGQPDGDAVIYGEPDPTAGATGDHVYGYALGGTYDADLPQYHLTSGSLDCSDLANTHVSFQRWLNVERPAYDRAAFAISIDGGAFITLWENEDEVIDDDWTLQSFDIADLADDKSDVRLRWTMGVTDGSWEYSGWNIDDVEIVAVNMAPVPDGLQRLQIVRLSPNAPNPFNPSTQIDYTLLVPARTRLDVLDLRGRLIRVLLDEVMPAGGHRAQWNGRDGSGREVGSGTYVFRLRSAGETRFHKALLIR